MPYGFRSAQYSRHSRSRGPVSEVPSRYHRQNPLEYVVCEFRFPAILKIELEVPAAFQEAIRKEYPLFQENTAVNLAPPELLQALSNANLMPTGKSYLFQSMDEKWQISLSRQSFSLTCVEYRRWDDFQKHLDLPLKVLISCYEPQLFTRVGLRYRDLISRKRLNLTGVSWGELLDPGIVSFFHTPLAKTLLRSWQQVTLSLPRTDAQVTIQHGRRTNRTRRRILLCLRLRFLDRIKDRSQRRDRSRPVLQ